MHLKEPSLPPLNEAGYGHVLDFRTNAHQLFTKVFHAVHHCTSRYVVVYGSAASSKSYSVHQSELLHLIEAEEGDTLFLRRNAVDLRDSCYKLLTGLIERYQLSRYFKCVYSGANRCITFLPTGRSISFRGANNSEKLKSLAGIKRVVMEEADQFTFEQFSEIIRRARGYPHIQFILILNPVSELHWIKKHLCEEGSPYSADTTVFKFNYRDNCNAAGQSFISEQDAAALENLRLIDENQYRIYALGEWGVEDRTKKFIWAFEYARHVVPTQYDPEQRLFASFDFNVNPLCCTLFQLSFPEKYLRAIECIKLPNSDIWKMCDHLKASYPQAHWLVTGDSTGNSRQAISKENVNYYQVIQRQLGLFQAQFTVPTHNPQVEQNQLVVNAAFKLWTIEIDPVRCKPLIDDILYVEMDNNKKIIRDRSAPHRCADFLDTLRYMINATVRRELPYLGG